MMRIDKETYKIDEKNRYKTETEKTQIIIALSLRKDNFHINRLKHKEYGNSKSWSTYTVSRTGKVYQHYDPKYYTDFVGIKPVDRRTISVVMENMGSLIKNEDGSYINWLNEPCPQNKVIEKKWLGQKYWEKIPVRQWKAVANICKKLCSDFNIPLDVISFHQYHQDIIKFKGIVLKSNYFEDSTSINPLIDLDQFKELLNE